MGTIARAPQGQKEGVWGGGAGSSPRRPTQSSQARFWLSVVVRGACFALARLE